ncbi:protein ALTERED PHOSPHATE STARVATION RESPONSE 1-like isoform X2 [Hordeum vulgare subsp. vulgare]|uniref:protein ALTERED PHOSPHATE STARVATION RESPONSE 1-like isoform X2 n=1 Tax=Hordeum vulgare subsp. vulgare TaxID=112509 RepID=UPI001D1A558F|nr:protein ALTERED PHOSPHATE STARVATION RESPONSE 1-like isoform X2 [Hordeum vulgare subsp. vulgare]
MGCAQSKIDQEEAVCRCRDRKRLMADAVQARNAFAAAHSAYTILLKSTGGALSDFAHGEAPDPSMVASHSHQAAVAAAAAGASASALPPPTTTTVLIPPSPPPPPFMNFPHGSLQRSSSTPNIPMPDPRVATKNRPPASAAIQEEEEDGEEDDGHIITDSSDEDEDDDDDDDHDDDHHEHDDFSMDDTVHGQLPKRGVMDSMGSSPLTPPPPPQLNPSPITPASVTPPPPMPEAQMATWDYFFGPTPTPPPTLEQQADDTWMDRREKESVPEVKAPVMNPVVSEPSAPLHDAEWAERAPQTAPEKAKAIDELAANLPPSKPIVRKPPKAAGLPPEVHHQHASSMGSVETRKGKIMMVSASLLQIIAQLDDNFLRSSESAHDVSKKLEATRMHYHSNHADSRGHIDHSTKIMHVITWNRSFKNLPDQEDLGVNFEIDERFETHATVLDRMLAWEKKLYDEVKAGELMKIDYQKKVDLLHKQKKRGVKLETLEKTKAAVSHLHTSMANMWSSMHRQHKSQFLIISGIRAFEVPPVPRETTDLHYKQTCELRDIVREWHMQFEKLMDHQKGYIRALNAWLKLNLISIESNLKEKVSSPPRQVEPPIKNLLYAWHDQLERLPVELAKTAIKSFTEVISNIVLLQEEEVSLRRRCEETRRDLDRKRAQFEDWHRRYTERKASQGEEANPEAANTSSLDHVNERRIAIEEVEIRLKEEERLHLRLARQVREKTLANLRMHLPELFRNMTDFSFFCHDMYSSLRKSAVLQMPRDEFQG